MRKLNNVLIFLTSLVAVCLFVKDLNLEAYDRLMSSATIIFVLFIPRIFNKIFKIKVSDAMELVYIIFIILAQLLGSSINLYNTVWWYDLFAHFLSGILTSVLALVVMEWFGVYKPKKKVFNALFIICFALMTAVVWEFSEYAIDVFLGLNVQHSVETGVADTMDDMLVAAAGSLIVAISYLIEDKITKNGFLKKVVNDIK